MLELVSFPPEFDTELPVLACPISLLLVGITAIMNVGRITFSLRMGVGIVFPPVMVP